MTGTFYIDPEILDANVNGDIGEYTVAGETNPNPYMKWVVGEHNPDPYIVYTAPTGSMTIRVENDQFNIILPGPIFDRWTLESVGNIAGDTDPTPFIETIGFSLFDTTPHALSGDELLVPDLAEFTNTESVIIVGCGAPGSGGSCNDPDAQDVFRISAVITSMQQQSTSEVPAASTWGIAVLALTLLVGARVHFRKRVAA